MEILPKNGAVNIKNGNLIGFLSFFHFGIGFSNSVQGVRLLG
jgi:hypothetical protein